MDFGPQTEPIEKALKIADNLAKYNSERGKVYGICYLISGATESVLFVSNRYHRKPLAKYRANFGYTSFTDQKAHYEKLNQVFEACTLRTHKEAADKEAGDGHIYFKVGVTTSNKTAYEAFKTALENAGLVIAKKNDVAELKDMFSVTSEYGKLTLHKTTSSKGFNDKDYVVISSDPLIALQRRAGYCCRGDKEEVIEFPITDLSPVYSVFCLLNPDKVDRYPALQQSDGIRIDFKHYDQLLDHLHISTFGFGESSVMQKLPEKLSFNSGSNEGNLKNCDPSTNTPDELRAVVVVGSNTATAAIENNTPIIYSTKLFAENKRQVQAFKTISAAILHSASKNEDIDKKCKASIDLKLVLLNHKSVAAQAARRFFEGDKFKNVAKDAKVSVVNGNKLKDILTTEFTDNKIRIVTERISQCYRNTYCSIYGFPGVQVKSTTNNDCEEGSEEIGTYETGTYETGKVCLINGCNQDDSVIKLPFELRPRYGSLQTKALSALTKQFPAKKIPDDLRHSTLAGKGAPKYCARQEELAKGHCMLLSTTEDSLLFLKVSDSASLQVYSTMFGYSASDGKLKENMQVVYTACRLGTLKMQNLNDNCAIKLRFNVAFVGMPKDDQKELFIRALKDNSANASVTVNSKIGLNEILATEPSRGQIGVKGLVAYGNCIEGHVFKLFNKPAVAFKCVKKSACGAGAKSFGTDTNSNTICLLSEKDAENVYHTPIANTIGIAMSNIVEYVPAEQIISVSASASFFPVLCALFCLLAIARRYN